MVPIPTTQNNSHEKTYTLSDLHLPVSTRVSFHIIILLAFSRWSARALVLLPFRTRTCLVLGGGATIVARPMPSTFRRVSLCLLTCSLITALVSTAALSKYGSWMSRNLNENHFTTLLRKTSAGLQPDPSRNAIGAPDDNQQCWIFMHLQKCGGETIKKMLKDAWDSKFTIYDSIRWKFGDDFSLGFGEKLATGSPWKVIAGGYPEALRRSPSVEPSCRFFTMFRHPISRMVSAYFYCKVYQRDTACASDIVRARDVDLLTFAKHWSNFAVRQFALSFVPADDVIA